MSTKTLAILLLLLFAAQTAGFIVAWQRLDGRLSQVQKEMVQVQTQVAQLRLWKALLPAGQSGQPPRGPAPSASGAPATSSAPLASPDSPALARFLARLVLLRSQAGLGLSPSQLSAVRAALSAFDQKKPGTASFQAEAFWSSLDRVFTPPQIAWLEEQAERVESKAGELAGVAQEEGASLRDMLADYLKDAK